VDWSTAKHDTIPSVDLFLETQEPHAYLSSFLKSEGELFVPPYSAVQDRLQELVAEAEARKKTAARPPRSDVTPQRLRSWKAVFEGFGLLMVDDDDRLQLTPLGRTIRGLHADIQLRVEGANDRLARIGINSLARHRLRNPLPGGLEYPEDSDLHPYRAIWRSMRALDNTLHWEELNRVLMHLNYQREEGPAIDHIRNVRREVHGKYDAGNVEALGEAAVDDADETRRRITPWFSQAGLGGMLIRPDETSGYWSLVEEFIPWIDDALDEDIVVPPSAMTSRQAYLEYLAGDSDRPETPADPEDQQELDRIFQATKTFGASKIICLVGIPGTGKTRLARMAALRLAEGDNYRVEEIQFHETTSYDDFIEGYVPRKSGEGFELRSKVFRLINARALKDPEHTYVLLIEELSRANIHAVIGELITYVEHRDRPFRLAISQDDIRVAPNLVLMATLNPRDKSALVLDHAIVRRIHQIRVEGSAAKLRAMLAPHLDSVALDRLVQWYEKFRQVLPFGHGVFAGLESESDLRQVWFGTVMYYLSDLTRQVLPAYEEAAREYPWA